MPFKNEIFEHAKEKEEQKIKLGTYNATVVLRKSKHTKCN